MVKSRKRTKQDTRCYIIKIVGGGGAPGVQLL